MRRVKRCKSCGHLNPVEEFICQNCPADIAGIKPEPVEEASPSPGLKTEQEAPSPQLELRHELFRLLIRDGDVVGREGVGKEHLNIYDTVSRQHARFFVREGQWYVEDMGSTNGTYVDFRLIREAAPLREGSTVGLGTKVVLTVRLQ